MKKQGIALLSALAVSAALIGGTLAYLNDTTEEVTNTFSSSKNIAIELREPAWDGYRFGDLNYPNGLSAKEGLSEEALKALGVEQAKDYVPGQSIPKDPKAKNVGKTVNGEEKGVAAKVALKVQYFDAENNELDYAGFKAAYLTDTMAGDSDDINFDTTKWTQLAADGAEKYDVFLYNDVVDVNDETTALFTEVPLSWDITADEDGMLPTFYIKVTAYALQSDIPAETLEATMTRYIAGM